MGHPISVVKIEARGSLRAANGLELLVTPLKPRLLNDKEWVSKGAILLNDKGCKVKNNIRLKVAATTSAKAFKNYVLDQVICGNLLASEKLTGSKQTKYINSLLRSESKANSAFQKISNAVASFPNATRSTCPTKNKCKTRDFSKAMKLHAGELAKINRILISHVAVSSRTFPSKENLTVNRKSLTTIRRLYRKSLSDANKLPASSEICSAR